MGPTNRIELKVTTKVKMPRLSSNIGVGWSSTVDTTFLCLKIRSNKQQYNYILFYKQLF